MSDHAITELGLLFVAGMFLLGVTSITFAALCDWLARRRASKATSGE